MGKHKGKKKSICNFCELEFEHFVSDGERKFCSRKCFDKGKNKENLSKPRDIKTKIKIGNKLKNRIISIETINKAKNTKKERNYIPKGTFKKGHKVNLGKIMKEETKDKIAKKHRQNRSKILLDTKQFPNFNINACKLIENYGKTNGFNFQHALNGGEYYIKELGYWVDGYDRKKNVVIEFYEKRHSEPKNVEYDNKREREIINFLKCQFIKIWE